MTNLFTIADKEAWCNYVLRSAAYDFYHTWYYHSMDDTADALLFVFEEGEDFIAYPFLKRNIPESGYVDFTCVYGYTGPLSNRAFTDIEDDFLERFKHALLNFLKEQRVVSVFSRLHPFFSQQALMSKFPGVHHNGKTVAIDLQQPIETQRSGYHRSFRQHIKQLKSRGYVVRETRDADDIRAFSRIYTENMKRVGATDYYLFTEAYFNDLLASDEFETKLMLVFFEGQPVSGGVFICTNKIMQAHLMGTLSAHISLSPPKLIIDEATILGREMGYEYLNLGGGLNFKEDTLFNWKAGFSHLFLDFNSWRYVVDQEAYDALVADRSIDKDLDVDFFPLYRYEAVTQ
jgi:lipid II:glycine glycyltransferase (peptidoglycan interpeptide bridge formation enzyme)